MILEDYLKKEDEQKIYGDDLKHEDNINTSLAAPGALAHSLQRRTVFNTSPPA